MIRIFSPLAALVLVAACSSGGAPAGDAPADDEAQQQAAVEDAIRQVYAEQGAEIIEIQMRRSADGSSFEGPATVRDTQTGEEIRVDCTYSRDPDGAPNLECPRNRDAPAS